MIAFRMSWGFPANSWVVFLAMAGCGRSGLWSDDAGSAGVGGDDCSPGCRPEPVALTVGTAFACALSTVGTVECWGANQHGQLGIGETDARGDAPGELGEELPVTELGSGRRAVAIDAGYQHACALLDDGSVKCWGDGELGALGLGDPSDRGSRSGEMGDDLPPVALGTGRSALAISVAGRHTCALLDDGSVKCWGSNESGELGLGDRETRGDEPDEMGDDLPAVDLGAGRKAVSVAVGTRHTCALLDDGSLKCWGANNWGALGLGDMTTRGAEPEQMGDALPAVQVGRTLAGAKVVVSDGTGLLFPDGTFECWGWNDYGQLGDGSTLKRGDRPGQLLDLPPVDLAPIADVRAAWGWKCALLYDRTLKCWGVNQAGQLGRGDNERRGDQPGEMGDALAAVDLGRGRTVVALDMGDFQACALLDDASVKCWGSGNRGGLGIGDTEDRGDEPGEMGEALPAVDLDF
jgi:alpha-tubulin suppressor-like RCC1 family protein